MNGSEADFKDHFSGHAEDYARFRPGYPAELFEWLATEAPGTALAWDAGTGNGQVARGLAAHFDRVLASDASLQQIDQACGPDNVKFRVGAAQDSGLPSGSVDLVTVGQALHWFPLSAFFEEAQRVLRPGGLFAAWTYQLNRITPQIDAAVLEFYRHVVGAYWPPERRHVEEGYAAFEFPFNLLPDPGFSLHTEMNLESFLSYVGTWSSVRRFRSDRKSDPIPVLRQALQSHWGDKGVRRKVTWPMTLRAGIHRGQ